MYMIKINVHKLFTFKPLKSCFNIVHPFVKLK